LIILITPIFSATAGAASQVLGIVVLKEVWERSWFSTSISLYLRNDTRYGHSYTGRRI